METDRMKQYFLEVNERMNYVIEKESEQIGDVAKMMFECTSQNGTIYFFGTGHSYMVGQEVFARAGGYAGFTPICQNELGMNHAYKSTLIERTTEYAQVILGLYHFRPGDLIVIISNSGRNNLIIELALALKKIGVKIIALTALEHSNHCTSRHKSGYRLFELADIVLDNRSVYGDASIVHNETTKTGPTSTVMNCFIIQLVVSAFVQMQIENGIEPPVFRSSNMDGADEYNKALFRIYE